MRALAFPFALTLSALSLAVLTPPTPALAEAPRTLTVTGQGSVATVPDMALVQVGVERRGDDAGAAMDAVSTAMAGLLDLLEARGIDARDVQSSSLSLDMDYRPGASPRGSDGGTGAGYIARSTLRVRLRDMSEPGAVLQALLDAGANSFGGLSFGVQDPQPLEDEARRLAVADARARAELYAQAAGVSLGPVLSMTEGGGRVVPMGGMARMAAAPEAMPLAAGETEIGASVTIVWEIAGE